MKLFDYKFLILLALTLVVYFIFREVLDLRKKIENLKDNVDNLSKLQLENKKTNTIDNKVEHKVIENKPTKNVFQIPLPKKVENNNQITNNEEIKATTNVIPNLVHNKLSTVDEVIQSESELEEESNNGERLAIYSNDNHEDLDSYSLEDSSEINTNDIINNLSEKSSEKECDEKKKNSLVEIEGNNELVNLQETTNNLEIKKIENEDDDSSELEAKLESINFGSSNSNSEEVHINLTSHSISSLMKLKLNQLKCLAEENRLEILNDNGKKKNKSQLAKELSAVLNKASSN